MPNNIVSLADRQVYDHHHHDEDFWTPPPAAPAAQPPAQVVEFPAYRGRFQKGHDPRRHQFTQEERSKGFWTAIAKLGISAGQKLHDAGRWPQFRGARKAA